MPDLPLNARMQRFSAGQMVELYELDATKLGLSVYHFTDGVWKNGFVSFGGVEYVAAPVKASGWTWSGQGELPRPKITVSNVDSFLSPLIMELSDFAGATLRRIRTFTDHFDGEPDEDGSVIIGPDVFNMVRLTEHNPAQLTWELAIPFDQEGFKIPGRVAQRDYCDFVYRFYDPAEGDFYHGIEVTCPYDGDAYFDLNDQPTDIAHDACSHLLSGCRLRFPGKVPLPFDGFPGMGRFPT